MLHLLLEYQQLKRKFKYNLCSVYVENLQQINMVEYVALNSNGIFNMVGRKLFAGYGR